MKSNMIVILALGLALAQFNVGETGRRIVRFPWLNKLTIPERRIMDTITIRVNDKKQKLFQSQEIISLLITLGPLSEMHRCYNKIHRC